MSGLSPRLRPGDPGPWDRDGVLDAVAITEAALRADIEGVRVMLRHASSGTGLAAVFLLAGAVRSAEDGSGAGVCVHNFRSWAIETAGVVA